MKLPSHKLRRVRQTVYEDPGNPFSSSREEGPSVEVRDDKWRTWPVSDPWPPESSGHYLRNVMAANATDKSTAQRTEARRTKSVALPPSSALVDSDDEEQYVVPRTLWRRGSERRQSSQRGKDMEDKRDTRFYGFYDEIMSDYRRGSRGSRFF